MTAIRFRPIELPADARTCLQHRIDSYVVSFGDAQRFYAENGDDGARYLTWLQERLEDEGTTMMALDGDEVVGQIESMYSAEHEAAHVFLYYVVPARRRQGIGSQLDAYVTRLFRARGCKRLTLHVSRSNEAAIRFYEARGWVDGGPSRRHPDQDRRMERALAPGDEGANS